MRLLVDAGNTAIKWGLWQAGEITSADRFVHRGHGLEMQLTQSWGALPRPANVYVANVAGKEMSTVLIDWLQQHWTLTPEFISTSANACGVANAYPVAETLGVDRWAALVAAHHHHRGAVCIIDCGTAITLDLLAADGGHQGGLILPGIELLKQAVLDDTAGTGCAAEGQAANLLASSTGAGVHSGAVYMAVAAIDRIVSELAASQEQDFDVVITGGDAGRILTLLAHPAFHDPKLVLKGLAILAGEN
jgi:type III pantothenate kinase